MGKEVSLAEHSIDGEDGWEFSSDRFGDWRGVNERAGLRTRLKFTLEWARHDVAIKRLQQRVADGTWVDRIKG